MRGIVFAVAVLAGAPLHAGAAMPEPNRIVYWGNSRTGAAVRVANVPDAEKVAKAEVEKIGGEGWSLLENSTVPGNGAAICAKQSDGSIRFFTAHGFDNPRDAVAAARAKVTGGSSYFCAKALWTVKVPLKDPPESGVMDYIKGTVRKSVVGEKCEWKDRPAAAKPTPAGEPKPIESKPAACPARQENGFVKNGAVCMCVRG